MSLPQNSQAIYSFLVGQGLSPNAAAGILGNIGQESGGNPESVGSGGGGLYGATPLPAGMVTGNATKDLAAQLGDLMNYIRQNGSVADINAHASSPTTAATWFSTQYERPGKPALANRIQNALDVAAAAKSGNWKGSASLTAAAAAGSSSAASGSSGGLLSWPSQITDFFKQADTLVTALMWITQPSHWLRIVAFLAGVALLLVGVHALIAVGEGGNIMPQMPNIVPIPV